MSNLKKAMVEADASIEKLKQEIMKKDTLMIGGDEFEIYKMLASKLNDIISLINYIGKNQNELCKTNRTDTI